jgi:hypothetical protein
MCTHRDEWLHPNPRHGLMIHQSKYPKHLVAINIFFKLSQLIPIQLPKSLFATKLYYIPAVFFLHDALTHHPPDITSWS